MFEDKTYENLLADALEMAPDSVDTRQGSIYRDALTGPLLALADFYTELGNLITLTRVDTAVDEYLDDRGTEFAVERDSATPATYKAVLEGVQPEDGTEFIIGEQYFDLFYDDDDGTPYFECVEPGVVGNGITEGTEAVPVDTIDGLTAASVGAMIEAGVDEQDDEDYRARIQERISGPAENGNKQHYKTWCESVSGVGHAKIIPLWAGPNTVKGIIYDTNGLPASAEIVAAVQSYVDPDDDGDGIGDGLGEGAAEIGAHFTAVAPSGLPVDVSATVTLAEGYDLETATESVREAVAEYLKDVAIEYSGSTTSPIIRYNAIGSLIIDAEGILDYSNLLLNGDTANIQPGNDEVCVTGTLTLTEST